jgi:large subunit ribosomal protein L3
MSGRMGADMITVKHLTVIDIDLENNLIFLKGAIPGPKGRIVKIESKPLTWK